MKYHVVSKEGVYSLQGNEKISYATMLMTRVGIVTIMAKSTARMATIATRYSLVRKQFKNNKG
jgi:acyl-CoA oxidase